MSCREEVALCPNNTCSALVHEYFMEMALQKCVCVHWVRRVRFRGKCAEVNHTVLQPRAETCHREIQQSLYWKLTWWGKIIRLFI